MADLVRIEETKLIPQHMVTTLESPPVGYEFHKSLGVVKGISVRLRNICVDICIGLNAIVGGKNYLLVQLYKDTRTEAFNLMLEEAAASGANCVVGVRYESTDVGVLCYGTAVIVRESAIKPG